MDHYQVSLICLFSAGAWFTAGLAGSDRWPSSMSGDGMVGRPCGANASRSCGQRHIGRVPGLSRGGALARWSGADCGIVAKAGAARRAGEPAGAKGGGTPRLNPLAIMWPPCSAAIPLNDNG